VPHAYQAPCAPPLVPTSPQKTTEPTRLLDLTQDRLDDDLATAGPRLTGRTPNLRRHTFLGCSQGRQGRGCRSRVPLAFGGCFGLGCGCHTPPRGLHCGPARRAPGPLRGSLIPPPAASRRLVGLLLLGGARHPRREVLPSPLHFLPASSRNAAPGDVTHAPGWSSQRWTRCPQGPTPPHRLHAPPAPTPLCTPAEATGDSH
jgi:hypothetical protein